MMFKSNFYNWIYEFVSLVCEELPMNSEQNAFLAIAFYTHCNSHAMIIVCLIYRIKPNIGVCA